MSYTSFDDTITTTSQSGQLHRIYDGGGFLESITFQPLLFENDWKAIIPESFLVLSTLLLLVYGVVYSGSRRSLYPVLINNIGWLTQLCLLFSIVLLYNNPLNKGFLFYNSLIVDQGALFLKILVCVGSLISVLISQRYVQQECVNAFELHILHLLSTASMLFLVSACDFICMYLAIELQSLCFYVMAGYRRNSEFSTEAGLKYFLLGAFSSGILLFGCSMVYGFTGTTNLFELSKILTCGSGELLAGISSLRACELGMVFILVGFLFKLTAVPFHMWAPDVYEGAPTNVTAFFSIVPKVSVLAVSIRLFYQGFFDLIGPWHLLLLFSSLASMILGSLAALSQNKIKRLLAYSSIGHVGYLLIGFSCGTVEGIQALLFYLVVYIVMTINLFAVVLSPLRRGDAQVVYPLPFSYPAVTTAQLWSGKDPRGTQLNMVNSPAKDLNAPGSSARFEHDKNPVEQINHTNAVLTTSDTSITKVKRVKYTTDLAMLAKTNPVLASTLTVTMFSIAGIPPLAGFYSKAFLMFAAISASQYLLAIVGVLTSVISCFYYIRIVQIMYFKVPEQWCTFMPISYSTSLILGLTFSFLLFFSIYPTPLFLATHQVALALCF